VGELHRAIKPEKVTCQWQIFEIMESMTIAKCTTVLPQSLHLRRRWQHLFPSLSASSSAQSCWILNIEFAKQL
jgi:hypothetical protein